jgi:Predicted flavin-nucleotide-binding protein
MSTPPDHLIPSRLAKRAYYDKNTIYRILDEALYCTVSYAIDNKPFSIPTAFARYGDKIYIHGSVGSHFIREIEKGLPVCLTATLIDALVVAKSAFHHSMNYRSVVIFARPEKIEDITQKTAALEWLTNKMVPGSWHYLRPVKENEVRKTAVLAFSLAQASAKVRDMGPVDDDEDMGLPIWSGLIPIETVRRDPMPAAESKEMALPAHLQVKGG